MPSITNIADVVAFEEGEMDAEQEALMMQSAINSGMAWRLQGSYGRSAMDAIKAGRCMLGVEGCFDYYGNYVPSREQVKDGTHGSRAFVVEQFGEEWAKQVEAV